jgi:hypothetical protein
VRRRLAPLPVPEKHFAASVGVSPGRSERRYTKQERRDQLLTIEELLARCQSREQIYRVLVHQWPQMTRTRVTTLMSEVYAQWAKDEPQEREVRRAKQLRGLELGAAKLYNLAITTKDENVKVRAHEAHRRHIETMSLISGTQQPANVQLDVNVNVNATANVLKAIHSLTPEIQQQYLLRAAEIERKAQAFDELQKHTIDVEGQAAE